jgi:hypothetical protein
VTALDRFADEVHAAYGSVVGCYFRTIAERLQASDDIGAIEAHDEIVEIVSRRAPLRDRMAAILRIKE